MPGDAGAEAQACCDDAGRPHRHQQLSKTLGSDCQRRHLRSLLYSLDVGRRGGHASVDPCDCSEEPCFEGGDGASAGSSDCDVDEVDRGRSRLVGACRHPEPFACLEDLTVRVRFIPALSIPVEKQQHRAIDSEHDPACSMTK